MSKFCGCLVFDRVTNQLRAFQLVAPRLEEINVPETGLWLPEVELGLGVWQGKYQNVEGLWLRWYSNGNQWIPTSGERAEQERQRAEQERQRAEQERQRAERLAERLRELGIDPDEV